MIFWLICGVSGTATMIARQARSGRTELIVTADELVARGDIGRMFSSEITIKAAEITAMQYQAGDEGAPSGLYVRHGWLSTCLVEDISEQQTNHMLDESSSACPVSPLGTATRHPSSLAPTAT